MALPFCCLSQFCDGISEDCRNFASSAFPFFFPDVGKFVPFDLYQASIEIMSRFEQTFIKSSPEFLELVFV